MSQQPLVLSSMKSNVYFLHLPWCGFIDESVRWVFIFHTILVVYFPSSNNTRPGKSQAWYKMKEVFKFSFNVSSDDEDASEPEEYAFSNSFAYMHICINMHLICTMSFYSEFHLPIVPLLFWQCTALKLYACIVGNDWFSFRCTFTAMIWCNGP